MSKTARICGELQFDRIYMPIWKRRGNVARLLGVVAFKTNHGRSPSWLGDCVFQPRRFMNSRSNFLATPSCPPSLSAGAELRLRSHRLTACLHGMGLFVLAGAITCFSGCASFHQATVEKRIAAEKLSLQGMQAMRQGDAEKAARYLREATLQKPNDVYSRTQLAEAFAGTGQTEAAIRELQTAIELSPTQCGLHTRLGEMYLQAGQMLAAEHQVEQALSINQTSGAAWQLRGELDARKGDWENALKHYQLALVHLGESPAVQMKIAEIYRQQQRPLRALATLEPLAEQAALDETSPSAAITLYGLVLNDLKQYDRAVEQFKIAANRPDASPESFIGMSQAYWMRRQPAESLFALQAGQRRFPQLPLFSELIAAIPGEQTPARMADNGQ